MKKKIIILMLAAVCALSGCAKDTAGKDAGNENKSSAVEEDKEVIEGSEVSEGEKDSDTTAKDEALVDGEALYEEFLVNILEPEYGSFDGGVYSFKEGYYYGEPDAYFDFNEEGGVLNHRIADIDKDGEDEMIVLSLVKNTENYDALLEVYEVEDKGVVLEDSYLYESVFGLEEVDLKVILLEREENYYIGLYTYQEAFNLADGANGSLTLLEYKDSKLEALLEKVYTGEGVYSGCDKDVIYLRSQLRGLGLDNSADCQRIVVEDNAEYLYRIKTKVTDYDEYDPNADHTTLYVDADFSDSKDYELTASDFGYNDRRVSFIDEDFLLEVYEKNEILGNDMVLYDLEYQVGRLLSAGAFHISLDRDSVEYNEDSVAFNVTVVENGEKYKVDVVKEDEYWAEVSVSK